MVGRYRFDAASLKQHVENDWEARLGREITVEQRESLSRHLDELLSRGAAVSPLPQDKALIDATRARLASVPLNQRVYNRLRQQGLGAEFPEVTVVSAGGANVQNVFVRASGRPLTSQGVPGLFTYDGYHKGFQKVVDDATKTLAAEQSWVLGVTPAAGQAADGLLNDNRITNDVRRLYLNDYRDTWRKYIDDIKLQPLQSMAGAIEKTRFLSGPDSPLPPMLKTFSRHTTLLAGQPGVVAAAGGKVGDLVRQSREALRDVVGTKAASTGAPGERIESIVDDEFKQLRAMVTAPEGGKPPIDGLVARLQELQVFLASADAALKAKSPPPASPLPTQLRVEGSNAPEPLRALLEQLGSAAGNITRIQLRAALSERVRSEIGEFCGLAVNGRYPFDPVSIREVTPSDFAQLFGPGGRFERLVQGELAPYIDTSVRPWRFRAVDGIPLGADLGTLPQFQRAQAIREAFFPAGSALPGLRLMIKPLEMNPQLREFVLDVDGQVVRYDHGPQIPVEVKWPGPKGTGLVSVVVKPSGTGLRNDGPWALFRLFERVTLTPGNSPERFLATFEIDGRKAVFDVTNSSVRNPMRMPELRSFQCPNGL